MYIYLFIKYFIIFCMILGICIRVVPIFVAAHNVMKNRKLQAAYIAQLENEESEEPEEPPFYILDKLEALDAVIESNRKLLEVLNAEYEKANTPVKRAAIRKKQADIMVKLANTEEKAYKLREKNGL